MAGSRSALAAAVVVVAALAAGCGSSSSSATTSTSTTTPSVVVPKCSQPPAGIGPDAAATLQLDDRGRTVCLQSGTQLTVFLQAPSPDAQLWAPIAASDPAVLEPGNTGIMTLVRGVTGGVFRGAKTGVAHLSSTRGTESWDATVVVTPAR